MVFRAASCTHLPASVMFAGAAANGATRHSTHSNHVGAYGQSVRESQRRRTSFAQAVARRTANMKARGSIVSLGPFSPSKRSTTKEKETPDGEGEVVPSDAEQVDARSETAEIQRILHKVKKAPWVIDPRTSKFIAVWDGITSVCPASTRGPFCSARSVGGGLRDASSVHRDACAPFLPRNFVPIFPEDPRHSLCAYSRVVPVAVSLCRLRQPRKPLSPQPGGIAPIPTFGSQSQSFCVSPSSRSRPSHPTRLPSSSPRW